MPVIAVHGCIAQNLGRKILSVGDRSGHHLSIRFADTHIIQVQSLGGGGVSKDQLSELLHARLILYANRSRGIAKTGSIVFKAHPLRDTLEDVGLAGCVFFRRRRWGSLTHNEVRQKAEQQKCAETTWHGGVLIWTAPKSNF